jgi:hypothetical protein
MVSPFTSRGPAASLTTKRRRNMMTLVKPASSQQELTAKPSFSGRAGMRYSKSNEVENEFCSGRSGGIGKNWMNSYFASHLEGFAFETPFHKGKTCGTAVSME